jgi:hypothetical protein
MKEFGAALLIFIAVAELGLRAEARAKLMASGILTYLPSADQQPVPLAWLAAQREDPDDD